jgi:hypothetical protein
MELGRGADMKKWLPVILLVCALAGGVWYFSTRSASKSPTAASSFHGASPGATPGLPPAGTQTPAFVPNPALAPGEAASVESAGGASAPSTLSPSATPFLLGSATSAPAMDAATVLGNMRITINQYGSMFGGNPVGTNPEITRALNGDNPKQVKFIKEDAGLRINGREELVDYWGTPFFFHQLSGTEMEIRSAGSDKVMWTADDLVIR